MPKKDEKVPHPCIYLGKMDVLCSSPEMEMQCEKFGDRDTTTYAIVPDDCVECLLANVLVHLTDPTHNTAGHMKAKDAL